MKSVSLIYSRREWQERIGKQKHFMNAQTESKLTQVYVVKITAIPIQFPQINIDFFCAPLLVLFSKPAQLSKLIHLQIASRRINVEY